MLANEAGKRRRNLTSRRLPISLEERVARLFKQQVVDCGEQQIGLLGLIGLLQK